VTVAAAMKRYMRAAVLAGPRCIRISETEVPEPGPGELLVKVEGCGVSASNIPLWEGRSWFEYPVEPGAPGHEGWGVIESVGPGVAGFRTSERVTYHNYHSFAEFVKVPEGVAIRIPQALDDKPFPGAPLASAINVFKRSDIRLGQTVAILGTGFLGTVLTALATRAGAHVIAVSRRSFSREIASFYGADEALPMDDHWKIMDRVKALTSGRGCDRVIEATGMQWPLDLAGELSREGGRLVIAGYHQDGPREVNLQLWNQKGLDVVNAHDRSAENFMSNINEAIEAVTSGGLDITPLCTHDFRLEEMEAAYELLQKRPEGFIKAIVRMHG
jgi:threonine dehydrogenase-like Zn-dependent dehydrogenase